MPKKPDSDNQLGQASWVQQYQSNQLKQLLGVLTPIAAGTVWQ